MTNTQAHALMELDILIKSSTDPNNRPIEEAFIPEILALCEKFGLSGQSGGSAPYAASAIAKTIENLCLQKTISPITGLDEEWMTGHMGKDEYQNKREGSIFKTGEKGRAYYLDAIVWDEEIIEINGIKTNNSFTGWVENISSRQYIKSFPFIPKTFCIDIYKSPNGNRYIKNKSQLIEVFEYYDEYNYYV